MTGHHFTIKEAAAHTGLSAYTLRYYEDIGLIDPVTRAANGHRRYTEDDLRRVRMLVLLRDTKMSLEEIQHFVELYRHDGLDAVQARYDLLAAHRERVQAQIDALCETLAFIDRKLDRYRDEIDGYAPHCTAPDS